MRDDGRGLKCTELNQNNNGTIQFRNMAEVDQIQKFGFCYWLTIRCLPIKTENRLSNTLEYTLIC
jgi:hypothetical protein